MLYGWPLLSVIHAPIFNDDSPLLPLPAAPYEACEKRSGRVTSLALVRYRSNYLALLEQKPNALDQAAPLAGWQLPEVFIELRRLMEARLGRKGQREYVQMLRLLETFAMAEVSAEVENALRLGAISFDAVRHLLLCRIERRPARLDPEHYPHLPMPEVTTTAAADYLTLLSPGTC